MTHAELGAAAGGLDYAAVNTAVRRLEMRRAKERAIKSAFRQVMEKSTIKSAFRQVMEKSRAGSALK